MLHKCFTPQDADEYIDFIRSEYGNFNYEKPQTIFDPKKIDEYLERMIGEQLSSASDASKKDLEFRPNSTLKKNKSRKRSAKTASSSGPPAKVLCNDTEFGEISKSMESLKQVNEQNIWKNEELQEDLVRIIGEKMALQQENAALIVEKMALGKTHRIEVQRLNEEKIVLKQKLDDAKMAKFEAEKRFDDVKKELMAKITALEMEKSIEDEKVDLGRKIATSGMNKNKNTCAHCRSFINSLAFCSDDCAV